MFQHFWKQCAGKANAINFSDFCILFDNQPFTGQRSGSTTVGRSTRTGPATTFYSTSRRSKGPKWEPHVIDNVRKTLRAASKSTTALMREFDSRGQGVLTQKEFRNALRQLGIGMTGNEIDQVLNYCDINNTGDVNWKEFCNRFKAKKPRTRSSTAASASY